MHGEPRNWTHAICVPCWDQRNPEHPARHNDRGPEERCCYCGRMTCNGIYVRDDPTSVHKGVDSGEGTLNVN
jgi:hypothetical protein